MCLQVAGFEVRKLARDFIYDVKFCIPNGVKIRHLPIHDHCDYCIAMLIWAITLLAGVVLLFAISAFRLRHLLYDKHNATIEFTPTGLRNNEVLLAIICLFGRSIHYAVWCGKGNELQESGNSTVRLEGPFKITIEDLRRYREAVGCKEQRSPTVSKYHLPFFLSAITEPAILLLLISPGCTISALGAVNVRNRFELLRPDCLETLRTTPKNVRFSAAWSPVWSRRVKRGTEHDLRVEVNMPGSELGTDRIVIFRQIFTMLEFGKAGSVETKAIKISEQSPLVAELPKDIEISIGNNAPWQWAGLCKDYNVIHLSSIAAKLFGLPGKLAHGNHVAARALESLTVTGFKSDQFDKPNWVEVQFRRPVVVPSDLSIRLNASGFSIRERNRECIIVSTGVLR